MPAAIPSHCFARKELHALISRADQLVRASVDGQRRTLSGVPRPGQAREDGELSAAFSKLAAAAADVDGILADMSEDAAVRSRHKDVLDNPYGWESTWVENTQVIHTDVARHVIRLSQQVLRKANNEYVATGRFRLSLDDKTYSTTDRGELRPALVSFLDRVSVPGGLRADLMAFVGVI